MKTIVSVVGTALLMGALALAQTGSGTTGTSKSSKKKASTSTTSPYSSTSSSTSNPSSSTSPSAESGSTGASSANSTSSGTTAGSSGFDSGLPQSDSSANAGTSAGQSGSAAYGTGSGTQNSGTTSSGTAGSSPSSSAQTGSAGSASGSTSSTQSGSSDEITNGPVAETVADSSAVIGWSTRSAASGTGVKYGTTRANMTETAQSTDGADGKNHHARLQGLTPSTRYYFQITENAQPVGGVGTFKTTASGETPVQSKAVIPQK